MGYPMTFGRFVNRNDLVGDYGTRLSTVNLGPGASTLSEAEFNTALAPHWREALVNADMRWGQMLGDLRRLEHDAQDEGSLCVRISNRIGVDPDVVGAVLKEFMSW